MQALGDLFRLGRGEQLQAVEGALQGREIEVAQVKGLVIEEDGATRARHEGLRAGVRAVTDQVSRCATAQPIKLKAGWQSVKRVGRGHSYLYPFESFLRLI